MKPLKLYGCEGCGSTIVEAALTLNKVPYEFIDANYEDSDKLKNLFTVNPLGQVPALVLPDGKILTESAAIINFIQRTYPSARLIPEDKDKNILYWRWQLFLIGAIYPTFTYGDFPQKWTSKEAGNSLRESTDEWRMKLWLQVENEVHERSFLEDFSALDLYLAVMVFWRPNLEWFKNNCPKIFNIADGLHHRPELKEVWKKNLKSAKRSLLLFSFKKGLKFI